MTVVTIIHNFRLLPCSEWDFCFPEIVHSADWWLFSDMSWTAWPSRWDQ